MLNIIRTNTMKAAAKYVAEMLKKADRRRIDVTHYVIVPDRASLEAERSILDNVGGSFNIRVMTFRRFANFVVTKGAYLSKQAGIIALSGIIADVKDKFVCYTKGVSTAGFVSAMYDTIGKLKYAEISSKELTSAAFPRSIAGKMADIALIYSEYEKFLDKGYEDSADRLEALLLAVPTSKVVSRSFFYFYDFDNFSAQETELISKLLEYSLGVTVACPFSAEYAQRHLYPDSVYRSAKAAASKVNCEIAETDYAAEENAVCGAIGRYLYSYETAVPVENDGFAEVFEGATRVQEVYALACRVSQYVRKGGRYKDVYALTSDVDKYFNAVTTVFSEFGIPYFCDKKTVLSDCEAVRYVTDYFTAAENGFRLSDVLCVVKNRLFDDVSDEVFAFENYCLKYNVSYDYSRFELGRDEEIFGEAEEVRKKLMRLILAESVPKETTAEKFVEAVYSFMETEFVESKCESIAAAQKNRQLIVESKISSQVYGKFTAVLDTLKFVAAKRVMKLGEFLDTLYAALAATYISAVPVSSDCVVFANMAKARKHDIKFLALLGANQGVMPIVKSDSELVSDKDIDELSLLGISLEPKIFDENKRERFSLYQLLREPAEKLFVSYTVSDGSDALLPSIFVGQLYSILTEKGKSFAKTEISDENVYTKKQALSKLILNRRRLEDRRPVTMKSFSALYEIMRNTAEIFRFDKDPLKVRTAYGEKLFLKNSETSVTRITEYFKCPYKFFLRYGLGVEPRRVAELKAADLGDILHGVLELYVGKMVTSAAKDVAKEAAKCFDTVINKDYYKGLTRDVSMRNTLARLKKEAVKMCEVVTKQLADSDFRNYRTEMPFGTNGECQGVEVSFGDYSFKLVGKIDRVDVCDGMFYVLDYKSGRKAACFDERDLYIGHKLQLPVYVKAVENATGMRPAGFYYFNMHDDFTDVSAERVYTYGGRTLDDIDVACKIDKNLRNGVSETLGLSLKKNGDFNRRTASLVTKSELDAEVTYALKLIAAAGEKMREGYIAVDPYKGVCDYCDYACICDCGDVFTLEKRETKDKVNAKIIGEVVSGE